MLTPKLCRVARIAAGWTQAQLGEKAGVSRSSVFEFEARGREAHRTTRARLLEALQEAGIAFGWPGEGLVRITFPDPGLPMDGVSASE